MSDRNNRVFLVGFVGAEPEIRETGTGKKVANIKLATNDTHQNAQGETITETQWHSLVAWGKLAEAAERNVEKGSELWIEGKLGYRSYVDKESQKRYVTEITVADMRVLREAKAVES